MIHEIDDDRVLERHLALIPVISQYDVIFMQEVIPESWQTIKANMQNYLHFEGISTGLCALDFAISFLTGPESGLQISLIDWDYAK